MSSGRRSGTDMELEAAVFVGPYIYMHADGMIGPIALAPQFFGDLPLVDNQTDIRLRPGPGVLADRDAAVKPGRRAEHEIHAVHGFAGADDDAGPIRRGPLLVACRDDVDMLRAGFQCVAALGVGRDGFPERVDAGALSLDR